MASKVFQLGEIPATTTTEKATKNKHHGNDNNKFLHCLRCKAEKKATGSSLD